MIIAKGGDDFVGGDISPSTGAIDRIRGGGGDDWLTDAWDADDGDDVSGGGGNDLFEVRERNNGVDTVECGGTDVDFFDAAHDLIAKDCEIHSLW